MLQQFEIVYHLKHITMKSLSKLILLFLFVFAVHLSFGQEKKGIVLSPGKLEDNRMSGSKKGYDHYQSKSDLKATESNTKAQDHNSSRSNKTGSTVAPDNSSGSEGNVPKANHNTARSNKSTSANPGKGENESRGIDDKTDTSPAARGMKPKPKVP
jgi:hypothetical protein